jgi:hypothetical protein
MKHAQRRHHHVPTVAIVERRVGSILRQRGWLSEECWAEDRLKIVACLGIFRDVMLVGH